MKPPLISRFRCGKGLRRQAGVTMVLVAIAMVAIIAMAALSIDVVTLYLARMEAQRAADGAALAAARVISVSGMTGDPNNTSGSWSQICGGSSGLATLAAESVATQSTIGAVAPTINVTYSAGGSTSPNCSGLPSAFGVNPMVTVQISRNNLPTFFSRVWGNTGNSVTASATAEAFNPSNSGNEGNGSTGTIIPVEPRCVKPWMVPNQDPLNPPPASGIYCNDPPLHGPTVPCNSLVNTGSGAITNPGISLNGGSSSGVIGETFWLGADCTHTGGGCNLRTGTNQPQANLNTNSYVQGPPNLLYVPGQAPTSVVALPSCASGGDSFEQAIAGCDQSTVYQCGVALGNSVNLSENPATQLGDTTSGVACLIHEGSSTAGQPDGQDTINDTTYPFQFLAGGSNPIVTGGFASGTQISTSNSIVSLPIYSNNINTTSGTTSSVTIVGFLQVFINSVDQFDNINVTVLNVSGCGNGTNTTGTAVAGSSPVPIRLITPP
jgi:Flp pilus assembly protein TadG